jgi:preprotein translocase subunit SecA
MFSLFKKSPPSIPYIDKVWKTEEAATKGMLMMAMMKLQQSKPCMIMAFFESELSQLARVLDQHQLKYMVIDSSVGLSPVEPVIYLSHTHPVNSVTTLTDWLAKNVKSFVGEVYFPGHYPLHNPEYKVLEKLTSLGYSSFKFCLSFDDPLLEVFGSQNILPLLEKLGLDDNESIEHSMVTQAIKRAREKVGEKVSNEIQAKSPKEWFTLNVKK